MPSPSIRSPCFLARSSLHLLTLLYRLYAGSSLSVPCFLSHCSCTKHCFYPSVSSTPSMHLVIEVFQRSQKDHMENISACIYGTHGRSIQAVNTILQHQNCLKHQTNIPALLLPVLSSFPHFIPQYVACHIFLPIFVSPCVFIYIHTIISIRKLPPHLCIFSCHNEKQVDASLRLHQNARFFAHRTTITAVQSTYL